PHPQLLQLGALAPAASDGAADHCAIGIAHKAGQRAHVVERCTVRGLEPRIDVQRLAGVRLVVHGDLQCRHAASVAQRQSPFPDLQTRVRLRPVRCGMRCHDGLMNDPIVSNVKSAGALRTLTWTNLAAQSAEQISLAAVPIVAVMVLQAGAGQIGALSTAQTLPFLLLSIPMGVLADRWSRARLMVLAEGVRALSLLALWLLVGY